MPPSRQHPPTDRWQFSLRFVLLSVVWVGANAAMVRLMLLPDASNEFRLGMQILVCFINAATFVVATGLLASPLKPDLPAARDSTGAQWFMAVVLIVAFVASVIALYEIGSTGRADP